MHRTLTKLRPEKSVDSKVHMITHKALCLVANDIMAGHAIVVVKDINLLFYHGNAVIWTL